MAELDREHIDKELLPFLSTEARPDVKSVAMQYFMGLTGNESGCEFICSNDKYVHAIISLAEDSSQPGIMKDALLSLINLSTYPHIARKVIMLSSQPDFALHLFQMVLKSDFKFADIVCSMLSNITRVEDCAEFIVKTIRENQEAIGFDKIITAFCTIGYNKDANLHYLGSVLSNLTQIQETRKYILDKKRCVVQRLLPFTEFAESIIRRGGIVATLHNCCFETEYHSWLLSEEVDLLPRLLLPLAGPEEIDDDDMEKLPVDLQYLEPDKTRETDPDIRKLLLDTLFLLCALKSNLEYIKEKNTYVILQKLHLWETDPAAKAACEQLVQVLIADEPPPENLREVEIPEHIESKLSDGYQKRIQEIEEETKQLSCGDNTNSEQSSDTKGGDTGS